jgi:hypothetical protein
MVMRNVTVAFRNPAPIDSCSQYIQRSVFSLRQLYPNASIELFNDTAGRMMGPVTINVDVRNGSTNVSGELQHEINTGGIQLHFVRHYTTQRLFWRALARAPTPA